MSSIISGHITVLSRVVTPLHQHHDLFTKKAKGKIPGRGTLQSSNLFWPNTTEPESTEFPKQPIIHTAMPNNGFSGGLEAFINFQPSFVGIVNLLTHPALVLFWDWEVVKSSLTIWVFYFPSQGFMGSSAMADATWGQQGKLNSDEHEIFPTFVCFHRI